MEGYAILMTIFGVCIFLYGVYVYYYKHPYLPRTYNKKLKEKDKLLVGKALMNISLAPILSASVTLFGDNELTFFLSWLVLITSSILILIFTLKKKK